MASLTQNIQIRQLSKSYGTTPVLRNVTLDIQPGEFLTLLGPSGSGKSTLLMVIAGFLRPDQGSLLVEGRELLTAPPHKRDIGLVFQNYALFPHMTVSENVGFPLRYRPMSKAERIARVAQALELVQMTALADRSINALSGGQRQRVALARAFVFGPAILLMDEPLSALDKKLRDYMQIELRKLHKKLGATTIYVTHDQREALSMSDRIAVLNEGCIAQIGTPNEIYERPNSYFVADFLGDAQFLRVEPVAEGFALAQHPLKAGHVAVAPGELPLVVVRPERVMLLSADDDGSALNILPCTVCELLYQGEQIAIDVELASGDHILVRRGTGAMAMASLPTIGARMRLALHPNDTVVVGRKP